MTTALLQPAKSVISLALLALIFFWSPVHSNGSVDLAELSQFASRWLDTCSESDYWCEGADINTSGRVDLLDFARFLNEGLADFSADYYVAANGNDSNPGTILAPFATLEKARQAVRSHIASGMTDDVTVMIRGGTYYISNTVAFAAADSGVNGHRVVYQNYPYEVPIIDGGVPITGWTETSPGSGLYQANANNLNFRQLYVNNQRGIRARWPNVDAVDPFFVATGGFMKYIAPTSPPANPPGPTTTSHYKIPKTTIAAWADLNRVEMVTTRAFIQVRTRIASYTTDTEYAYVYGMSPDSMGESDQSEGSYFFENAYEFIDAPGEWYLDTDTSIVYYKPLPGEDMSTALVVAPRVEQMVSLIEAQNITFSGLTFQHATWLLPSAEGLYHRQAGMRNYGGLPTNPGAIYLKSTGNIVFERNIIKHMGANGINLDRGVHDTMINGNVFYEIADTAINHAINWNVYTIGWIGGVQVRNLGPNNTDPNFQVRNDTIKNNYIYKMGVDYSAGGGIWSYYSIGLKILNNEIQDVPNIGINVGWGANLAPVPAYKDVEIKYNQIHNTCKWSNDSGGIHTKSNPENAHLFENWIYTIQKYPTYKTGSNWPFCGIYLDDGSDYFTVESNVVETVGDHQWYSGDTSGIGGLNIKVRNGGIGTHNTFINNAAQKVGPHPVTGVITVMQWPEFPEWGSPIDADTAQRVKANAGIEPAYIDIKN